MAAINRLGNASLLLFGDSTAYHMAETICRTVANKGMRSFISRPAFNRSSPYFGRAYKDLHHVHDHHFCRLVDDLLEPGSLGLPLGSLHHYGMSGEPLWTHAYPRPPWLGLTTDSMARGDAPGFCACTHGCAPTLVVMNSAFWDVSSWWLRENFTSTFRPGPRHVAEYVDGLRRAVAAMRRAFPTTVLAWRTAHPGLGHGISSGAIHTLNYAVRAHASELGLRIIDVGAMIDSLSTRSYLLGPPVVADGRMKKGTTRPGVFSPTYDGRHLHPYLDVEAFNLILTELERAWDEQPSSMRYPACETPRPPDDIVAVAASAADIDALLPARRCARHGLPSRVTHAQQLYVPLPPGEPPSKAAGCGRWNCEGRN